MAFNDNSYNRKKSNRLPDAVKPIQMNIYLLDEEKVCSPFVYSMLQLIQQRKILFP